MRYADIIVDISAENLDQTYQYRIPEQMQQYLRVGDPVIIPFGKSNRKVKGYVISFSNQPVFDEAKIKDILQIVERGEQIEEKLLSLAAFIRKAYGGTMNEALKTVLPVKRSIKQTEKKVITLVATKEELHEMIKICTHKKYTAKVRVLNYLLQMLNNHQSQVPYELLVTKLKVSATTIKALEKDHLIALYATTVYRNPVTTSEDVKSKVFLNEQQQLIVNQIIKDYQNHLRKTYLIHGVTGSGKTEVYMELIEFVISQGKQAIVLIPEIALTYQTIKRFQTRFLNRVSILNSKMSAGERYDQTLRAKNREIDIMIGPRSALFTPFPNLGLIVIDEEHEGTYKSEMPPKYHARQVAIQRAKNEDAFVVLGSATPSLEAYQNALLGNYQLLTLTKRAKEAMLPKVHIVDMKEELRNKNKSIFSDMLREKIEDRLKNNEQIMLFLNRRGYAGFVSCRSCGYVMKCPHCDISLTYHSSGDLKCHYCGYQTKMPTVCPKCGSKYIATFGTGTQKVETLVQKEFPNAKILRMDADTTKSKTSYEQILRAFDQRQADILIGTQMIVKGHDFEGVTLVGILAADLSLNVGDFRASEKTFQLLAQAAGRAGRGKIPGEVVIQTYEPNHYAIIEAAKQDYVKFYEKEICYRKMMKYPPAAHIVAVLIQSKSEEEAKTASKLIAGACKQWLKDAEVEEEVAVIGPAQANLAKVNDIFRRTCFLKSERYELLIAIKDFLEEYIKASSYLSHCIIQFDFDPMNCY